MKNFVWREVGESSFKAWKMKTVGPCQSDGKLKQVLMPSKEFFSITTLHEGKYEGHPILQFLSHLLTNIEQLAGWSQKGTYFYAQQVVRLKMGITCTWTRSEPVMWLIYILIAGLLTNISKMLAEILKSFTKF